MIEELFDYDFYSPSMENVLYICNELDEIIKDGHKELMIICYDYGCRNDIEIIKLDYDECSIYDYTTLYSFTGCNVSYEYLEGMINTNYNNVEVVRVKL